jgi:hypothetical protein
MCEGLAPRSATPDDMFTTAPPRVAVRNADGT